MAADLEIRLTGGAANAEPDNSIGGDMSSEELSATALNNLFDNVEPTEASAGDTEYRAIDIYNSGDATATAIEIYFSDEPDNSDTAIALALDSTTQTVADEDTAPSGVSFSTPLVGTKLSVSDIASGAAQRVWIRRTITAGASNHANDGITLAVQYA